MRDKRIWGSAIIVVAALVLGGSVYKFFLNSNSVAQYIPSDFNANNHYLTNLRELTIKEAFKMGATVEELPDIPELAFVETLKVDQTRLNLKSLTVEKSSASRATTARFLGNKLCVVETGFMNKDYPRPDNEDAGRNAAHELQQQLELQDNVDTVKNSIELMQGGSGVPGQEERDFRAEQRNSANARVDALNTEYSLSLLQPLVEQLGRPDFRAETDAGGRIQYIWNAVYSDVETKMWLRTRRLWQPRDPSKPIIAVDIYFDNQLIKLIFIQTIYDVKCQQEVQLWEDGERVEYNSEIVGDIIHAV